MSATKSNKSKDSLSISFAWLQTFQQSPFLMHLMQQVQVLGQACVYLPLGSQKADLLKNYELIQQHPLIKIQTQRLLKSHSAVNEEQFKSFLDLWSSELMITEQSHRILAPHQPYPRGFNAEIRRYQQYLLHVFFILLTTSEQPLKPASFMDTFVQYINGIQPAYTTSKVTLRVQPHIKSEILLELPKHSQVEVCAEANPYWRKIRIQDNDHDVYGYIMAAYLKYAYQQPT